MALQQWIDMDRRWDTRFRRAALVRRTSLMAIDADPGALYELAGNITVDLAQASAQQLPSPARIAASNLSILLSTKN